MAGRPKFEVTQEVLDKVKTFASQGLTKTQIAQALGIAMSTLMAKQKKHQEFMEAIKAGQAQGLQKVANALFDNALSGNTTAQIFYLKNRAPEEWKDRHEVATEDVTKKPIEMSDDEILAELRGHKGQAIGTGSKTTH